MIVIVNKKNHVIIIKDGSKGGWVGSRSPYKALFSSQKFQDFSSHRIFSRMHGALNIDENKKLIAQFTCNL